MDDFDELEMRQGELRVVMQYYLLVILARRWSRRVRPDPHIEQWLTHMSNELKVQANVLDEISERNVQRSMWDMVEWTRLMERFERLEEYYKRNMRQHRMQVAAS